MKISLSLSLTNRTYQVVNTLLMNSHFIYDLRIKVMQMIILFLFIITKQNLHPKETFEILYMTLKLSITVMLMT